LNPLAQVNLDTTTTYTVVNNIVADLALGLQQAPATVSPTVGIGGYPPVTATLDYNDVYGWDEAYRNVTAGAHDISVDPLFVDSNAPDLHLTAYSPCIDRGTSSFPGLALPSVDIDGDSRPQGKSHDMGADEYLQRAYVPVVLRRFP
jgi:hypothetical protein